MAVFRARIFLFVGLSGMHAFEVCRAYGRWDAAPVTAWTVYGPLVQLERLGVHALEGIDEAGWAFGTPLGLAITFMSWAVAWWQASAVLVKLGGLRL